METSAEVLASYRVSAAGGIAYRALAMSEDEILERRSYVRQCLRNLPSWGGLTDSQLDQVLVYRKGDGYIVQDEEGYDFYCQAVNVSAVEAKFRKERSMMPFDFLDVTGKDFDWAKYQADISGGKKLVNQYIMKYPAFRAGGMGLYIYSGAKGSGKTMLACCILNEIAKRYVGSVKFVNSLDFLEITKKGYQGSSEEVNALYQAGLLVIDDIGVQMSREWTDTVFYRLINERYTNRKPTIYTSNIPVEGLKMDDRITDRIESTTYLLRLPDESIRKILRQEEKDELLQKIEKGPGQ